MVPKSIWIAVRLRVLRWNDLFVPKAVMCSKIFTSDFRTSSEVLILYPTERNSQKCLNSLDR